MNEESWMNNPSLGGIDPAKLQMLAALADQAKGKSQTEMLPFLMSLMSQQKNSEHMSFNSSEADAIINVMKLGKSPQEIARIDKICSVMRQFRK